MAESLVYESRIKIPYTWSTGETGTYFFTQLRDHRKIFGTRCGQCGKVRVPPRKNCPACFVPFKEWFEVGPVGTLLSYTEARYDSAAHPDGRPVYGLIKLDGADTSMLHLLFGVGEKDLKKGLKVRAVFKEERRGEILDILCFKPD